MKKAFYSSSIAILFTFLSSFAYAQILWDQTSGMVTGGIASQDFETANDLYDCAAADDIVVPSGSSWLVDSIRVFGQYSATFLPTCPILMTIYTDSLGFPSSNIYYQESWTQDLDVDDNGDVLLVPECPFTLSAQRYWLSVQSTKVFGGGGGQWYWTRDSVAVGSTFMWRNPGNGFATSCSTNFNVITSCVSGIVEPSVAFTIYGCVNPPSIGAFGADTTICSDETLILTPDIGNLSNPGYSWTTGDSTSSIQVTATGSYTVRVTDPNTGCYGAACIDVIVNQSPDPTGLANDTICDNENHTFNGFANCGTCQYLWNDSATSPFYTTSEPGWHYLSIANPNNGCTSFDSVWLEVESTNPPELAPGLEIDLCYGDSVYVSTVNTYTTYMWSTGATTQGIYVKDGGLYAVTVTTPSGCEAADTLSVTERFATEPTIVVDYTADWKIRLTASAGYQTYLWSNGETDPVIVANSTDTYTLTVTDEFGCRAIVSQYIVVTGVNEIVNQQVAVYPNPASGEFLIEWPAEWADKSSYELMDIRGRLVKESMSEGARQRVDVSDLSPGYYILRLKTPVGYGMHRLAIE